MNRSPLQFERITVDHAPGIPRGEGFTLDALSPTVTLVYGPNGAGKTTTARLLHALLWPGRTELARAAATGRFALDGRRWDVELDAGSGRWWRDGEPADGPDLGPPEPRTRYWLALDQLIQAKDEAFAKQVADATLGGYDLTAAAEALGYREKPPIRAKARNAVEQNQQALREAQRRQHAVAQEAGRLESLRQQKADADAAAHELHQLTTAREYQQHEQTRRELQARLDQLPACIAEVTGDELETARELEAKAQDLRRQINEQQKARDAAADRRDACRLPEGGVEPADVQQLRAYGKTLEQEAGEIARLERERRDAASRESSARGQLSAAISDEQLDQLNVVTAPNLNQLAREAEQARAKRQVLNERRRWLAGDDTRLEPADEDAPGGESAGTDDAAQLRHGLTLLSHWLRCGEPRDTPSAQRRRHVWLVIALAALATALALVLALVHHLAWLATLPLPGITAWFTRPKPAGDTASRAAHYQADYESLTLPQPTAWTPDPVAETIATLSDRLASAKLEQAKRERLRAVETEAQTLDERAEKLSDKRRALEQQLGIDIPLEDEWLAAFIDTLNRFHEARDQRAALDAQLATARAQFDQTLERFNQQLTRYGEPAAEDVAAATARLESLTKRQTDHDKASSDAQYAGRLIDESLTPQLRDTETRYEACFTRLDVDVGDEAALRDLIDQRPRYRELVDKLQETRALRDRAADELPADSPLLTRSLDALEARIEQKQSLTGDRERLINEIRDIENHMQNKKAGSEVSDAWAAWQRARDELADKREADCRAVTGHVLTEDVRRIMADRARPAVFRQSSELLTRITRGRYRLELSDDAEPQFLAYDAQLERQKALHELSIGERVQLLIAVRLGFVEHEEKAARLPLLMDETLANADDERALAIIDAIIELARDGRQVFYFSAQPDGIARWRQRLDAAGLDYTVKDLARIRKLAAAEQTPLPTPNIQRETPPAPDGHTHESYGRALNVPGLDPKRQTVGAVHLWHLIDDPAALHTLLTRDIDRWGKLAGLIEQGGAALLPGDGDWRQQLRARASALQAAFDAWRIGRGRPIDRQVLADSGAVSDRFIDKVSALAADYAGDPEALLEGLANKQVPGWQQSKTQELRDYLEANGYLDPRPPATSDDIHTAVLTRLADDLAAGRIDQPWIDTLIARLTHE